VDVHLFVVVLYTSTEPFSLPLVETSTSLIKSIDSTTAGFDKLDEDTTNVFSVTATVKALSGSTTTNVSVMLNLCDLWTDCNHTFDNTSSLPSW